MKFKKRSKPKPRPKPQIDYPPVPTKKWIPPDKRKKPPKPEPKYVKPEGMTQKLTISSLKKVWHKYDVVGDAAILTGNFSQFSKRFSFKSNGLQGACNSAIACVYSELFDMATWTKRVLDDILIVGDDLYVRSTQQGDKCLIEVPPEKMHTSFFMGRQKVTLQVEPNARVIVDLTSASEEKCKALLIDTIDKFLGQHKSGIFSSQLKFTAIWKIGDAFFFFDPEEHDDRGNPWKGVPGHGNSFLGKFKDTPGLVDYLYNNYPVLKEPNSRIKIIPCSIARMVNVRITPPETFEDLAPKEVVPTDIIEEPPVPRNIQQEKIEAYVAEGNQPPDLVAVETIEMSPDVPPDFPVDKRPSFLRDGSIPKLEVKKYPVPVPSYLKGESARLTYYTELVREKLGILRGNTCQTDSKCSKYLGRQSMGNALSALVMLRICKSKHWIPKIVDTILKNGDLLYHDAMMSIPRTHTLRLSNFPRKIEYEGKKFSRDIDEYAVVGQLESQDYDILDLEPALSDMLGENGCCIILGPQTLAVWVEDGIFYMFDPNERDQEGKAVIRNTIVASNVVTIDTTSGVACVIWFKQLTDLVNLYMANTNKHQRNDRFYLSKVSITDYVDVSDDWYNYEGIEINKWILRGTFSQANIRFSEETRNLQGPANAMMALAMAILFDEREWSSDTVDEILNCGDDYYKKSVEHLKEKGLFKNPQLLLAELNKSQSFRGKLAIFDMDECVENGLIFAKSEHDVHDLRNGLENFFRDNDYGVLTTRKISLPVWKKHEAYFYLDPYNRNDKGVSTGYGTSCSVRALQLEDLSKSIEANLDSSSEDFFNITKVKITISEAGASGIVKSALKSYTAIDQQSAILRSWFSNNDKKYGISKGKQTVPMCVVAVSFNKLNPANFWTRNDMDIILDKGNSHYMESMTKAQIELDGLSSDRMAIVEEGEVQQDNPAGGDAPALKIPEPEDAESSSKSELDQSEDDEMPELDIKITSENLKPLICIGPNYLSTEFENIGDGNIKESLKKTLTNYFSDKPTDETYKEALLETKNYSVALWRDEEAYYVFDPAPRDKKGEIIGKLDWGEEPVSESDTDEEEGTDEEEEVEEADVEKEQANYDLTKSPQDTTDEEDMEEGEAEDMGEEEQEEEEEEEEKEPLPPSKPKHPESFWLEQKKSGRACTIWFTNLRKFVDFVYCNILPEDRVKRDFVLKQIKCVNSLKLKAKYNPEDERTDVYAGDWYAFKEFDYARWILRGSISLEHELFPEKNRGRQCLMASAMALAIAHTFEMPAYKETVPDTMAVYGDKLLTYMKKDRKKSLLGDPKTNLKEDEIDWLVQHVEFGVSDIPKKICIAKFMVILSIQPNAVTGDIKAKDTDEDVLNLHKGLEKLFEDSRYGIVCCKGCHVAVWKGGKMFYMYDGMKRGPTGVKSTIGSCCITRYMNLEQLVEVFQENIPIPGKNQFCIHKVEIQRAICPRGKQPKEDPPVPKSVPPNAGLKEVLPGKSIVRGTISQEDPRFAKAPNTLDAPIAVVALTMSLIHKPQTWSKPIIDDIVIIGSELFEDSVNELGFEFDPWIDKLDVYRVKHDYKIGVMKANCELRNSDQRGVIDVKDPNVQNLRQGLDHFFEENTHGILITGVFTLAIWEQVQDDGTVYYLFDPNPRNASGMPLFTGTACAVCFVNVKMVADHIIGCIQEPAFLSGKFTIVPVEIVVGGFKTKRKKEKDPNRSCINVLPRCSKLVASENKRKLRKLAEEERKRKEAKRRDLIGRTGYHVKGGEAILRGYKSQNHCCYDVETRDKQDIPNCIVSVVMHSLLSIDKWNHGQIDQILDIANQLFIDSYIAYGPKDPKLGMENVMRKFLMDSVEVHVTVYKPIMTEVFTASKLGFVLEAFFQQEPICILNYNTFWVSLFFKAGFYYLFDPHERDIEGNPIKSGQKGTAVVVRFDQLNEMTLKIVHNLGGNSDDTENFTLWMISVESK